MTSSIRKRVVSALISAGLLLAVVWMLFLKPPGQLSSYVPEHAAWYAEMNNPRQLLQEIENGILPYSDSGVSLVRVLKGNVEAAYQHFRAHRQLLEKFENQSFGISAHTLSEKESGYVFYLSCLPEQRQELAAMLEKQFRGRSGYRFERREYLGKQIIEVSDKQGKTFSMAFLKTAVCGSFSGFLLEEIIRNSGVFLKPGFASRLSSDSRYHHVAAKSLRLFINNGILPVFLQQFLRAGEQGLIRQAGDAMLLGVDGFTGKDLQFDGYIISQNKMRPSNNQRKINAGTFVPDNSRVLCFSLRKKELWQSLSDPAAAVDARLSLINAALEDELMLVLAEGRGLRKYDHLLIATLKNPDVLSQVLQNVAGRTSPPYSYREDYRGFQIFKHIDPELAAKLAGSAFINWSSSFYVIIGPYLLISDQIDLIRRCADRYLENRGVASSNVQHRWFEMEALPGRLVPCLMENAAGSFRTSFREWLPLLRAVRKVHMVDMGEQENPGISIRLSLKNPPARLDSLIPLNSLFLDSLVISDPVRLGQEDDPRSSVWLVQDLKKQIHWLDANFTILKTILLSDYWIKPPLPMRQGKPKDYSCLLTLPRQTLAFDAGGTQISDYSYTLPDSLSGLQQSTLIDYDHNFQYRLYLSGRHGIVMATDREGRLLAGWNPKKLPAALVLAPRHIRVSGRDYILLLDNRGYLLLTNRKGEVQPGFPLKLKGSDYSGWFTEPGLNEESSFVYCLSELGQMEKVNLRGVIVSSMQLFRPDVSTRFSLHTDQEERTFILARVSKGSVTLFDQSYRPVLEHKSEGGRFAIRQFNFGGNNRIFAVTDLDKKLGMLYDESGEKIIQKPFSSTTAVDIYASDEEGEKFRLLSVFENKVSLSEFYKN